LRGDRAARGGTVRPVRVSRASSVAGAAPGGRRSGRSGRGVEEPGPDSAGAGPGVDHAGEGAGGAGEVVRDGRADQPGTIGCEMAGGQVREGGVLQVGDDLFDMAWSRWVDSASSIGCGLSVNTAWYL
jgi:hypothetical protein